MSEDADVRERLARIETKLDILMGLDKRVRAVENKVWWASGAVGVAVAVIMPKVRSTLGL